jgi:PAS domain S-box-containing protein
MTTSRTGSSRATVLALCGALALLGAGIAFLGDRVFRDQRAEILRQQEQQLVAIAELKVREISFWRNERLSDARARQTNPFLLGALDQLRRRPDDPLVLDQLRTWLTAITTHLAYSSAALTDPPGNILLAVGGDPPQIELHSRPLLPEATKGRSILMTDLHRSADGGAHIGIFVPLLPPHAEGGALHPVLYLQIDPKKYLFPLIQTWPTPSPSGETLLVRRDGEDVVFLNDLRHRGDTAMRLRLPAVPSLPAGVAVRGKETTMVGQDYRGVRVLAVTRAVPDSPWFLVAKIDYDEVLGSISARARTTAIVSALVFLLATTFILLIWRQQRVASLRAELALAERHRGEVELAGAELRESEERYRGLFENMAEGIAYCRMEFEGDDPRDFVYLAVNDAFERLTGLKEVTGRRVSEVIPGIRDLDPELFAVYGRVARTGVPERFEMYVKALTMWFSLSVYCPHPGHFVAVFDVITERKRAEAALARTLADLLRSNEELRQFAYIASHDLQEPLRMIASFLQLIERRYAERLDEDGREFIGFAVNGAERLQHMIQGLLAYSRAEQTEIGLRASAEQALRRALANLSFLIEERGVEVTHDPLPTVKADEGQLAQVFQNLIENAVKFRGEAPPRVHITAQPATLETGEPSWHFSVSDNGIGIPARHAERIFGIFKRLHGQAYPGAGIGLAICRRIIERQGGTIWAAPGDSAGTTFHFTLGQCT